MSVLHRWLLVGGTAAGLFALGVTQVAAGRTTAVPTGVPPVVLAQPVVATTPSVSGDGSLVAYAGAPTTPGDMRGSTIFLNDRTAGTVVELTPALADVPAGESVWPVLSGDGCSVTFLTEMGYDLFRDDDGGARWDVYRQTLPACGGTMGDLELISASRGSGFEASAADDVVPTDPPAVSADGTVVAYTHQFSIAAPDLTGVMVVDLTVPVGGDGRATPVAGTPVGTPDSAFLHRGLRQPSLSADGTVLAYTSDATSAAPEPQWGDGPVRGGDATTDVYVWDRTNPDRATNVRVISIVGGPTGDADSPSVSGDGRFVAFVSTATNLVPGATLPVCAPACVPQVYLFGRDDGSLRLASRVPGDPAAPPVGANAAATQPSLGISDGEVLFVSRATNLFFTRSSGVGGPTDGDIVVAVPGTGEVRRVSVLADGVTPAPAANAHPHQSAAGRVVVFDTLAGQAFGGTPVDGRSLAIVDRAPAVEMANLDVGTVSVGYPGPEWYLVVTNPGPSSFVPATVTSSDPDFIISGGSCVDAAGAAVPPGGKCTVNLMLMPSVDGARSATLTVAEAGFQAVTVSATLTGIGGDPTLAPTPSAGYGGVQVVGVPGQPMPFVFENVAFSSVRITGLQVIGVDPQDFVVTLDECSGAKVAAGGTCTLQVTFRPLAAGRRTATVVASTKGGVYASILVSGDARYAPTLAVSDASVLVGSRFTLTGGGFAPSAVVTVSWADGAGHPFTVTTDATGSFSATMLLRATDRAGQRALVAQTVDGTVAAVGITVVPKSTTFGPGSPAWPGK